MTSGKVYLIGAGPGDVELLTLKAARLLGQSDVLLLDDLVNREILRFVRPGARIVEAGKRGGRKSTPQALIHQQLVDFAREGKIVARVKGGDPFVFGRGSEELRFLSDAGVAFEVVSGVTAGIAVPAALGIPVSHRELARSVTFVTGHTCDHQPPNWQALAKVGGTLVIYMGIANLAQITADLLAGGLAPTSPAAAIQHGTLPQQRSVVTTLAALPALVRTHGIGSPAIVIIGEVVRIAASRSTQAEILREQA
ncbi:MAG TPA: uroporphyrinogen-III C-methyltransferase [Candidatus Binataceae bacterium]|nr:uroporphyrinogen-III C-methyltransferase [Candidatus Binataceae bacterium]